MAFTINTEPTVVSPVIAELVRQAMFLSLAFAWVHWTQGQQAVVLSFTSAALAAVSILLVRSQSVPKVVADKQIEIAKAAEPTTSNETIIAQAKAATQ